VDLLLDRGAEVNRLSPNGETALSIADSQWGNSPPSPEIGKVLRQHGAIEDLQRSSSITVARGLGKRNTFQQGTNNLNRFTLFEAIAQHYMTEQSPFAFPDFSRVKLRRLKGKTPNEETVLDLETAFKLGDCSKDEWLEWGDLIEIPEQDRGISEAWLGFPQEVRNTLNNCLEKKVQVIVKGQTNTIALHVELLRVPVAMPGLGVPTLLPSSLSAVPATPAPEVEIKLSQDKTGGWLNGVVRAANVIRSSSDLSRVKVMRAAPITHEKREMTFDLRQMDKRNDLWLRNGDVIEIPEKP
ncbi:MAG TPA: hypothetical protein VNT99_10750, partial [Methylomirabilota bacterium]|nr:hypothetical protein [Methylomirabilota bacterium]